MIQWRLQTFYTALILIPQAGKTAADVASLSDHLEVVMELQPAVPQDTAVNEELKVCIHITIVIKPVRRFIAIYMHIKGADRACYNCNKNTISAHMLQNIIRCGLHLVPYWPHVQSSFNNSYSFSTTAAFWKSNVWKSYGSYQEVPHQNGSHWTCHWFCW